MEAASIKSVFCLSLKENTVKVNELLECKQVFAHAEINGIMFETQFWEVYYDEIGNGNYPR